MDTLHAYFAGAVDADGCISIYRKKRTRKTTNETVVYYDPRVSLGEVYPTIPDMLFKEFGGYRHTYVPKTRPRSRPYHIWSACNQVTKTVLTALAPYLVLKKTQAEIALKLCDLMAERNSSKTRSLMITSDEIDERARLCEQIQKLNSGCRRRDYASLKCN